MESLFALIIFLIVTLVVALVFGVWLVLACVRVISRVVGLLFSPLRSTPLLPGAGRRHATDCDSTNPAGATFCRRCGRRLTIDRSSAVRRVAMW